jgi:hypothetical protein
MTVFQFLRLLMRVRRLLKLPHQRRVKLRLLLLKKKSQWPVTVKKT